MVRTSHNTRLYACALRNKINVVVYSRDYQNYSSFEQGRLPPAYAGRKFIGAPTCKTFGNYKNQIRKTRKFAVDDINFVGQCTYTHMCSGYKLKRIDSVSFHKYIYKNMIVHCIYNKFNQSIYYFKSNHF